jgi:hypothetical protein
MEQEKSIQEQGRFARRLAEDIRALLEAVPFGSEVYRSRHDLERLARPVVAVTGAEGVGKSALIGALDAAGVVPAGEVPPAPGASEPLALLHSWQWKEVPRRGAEGATASSDAAGPAPLSEGAEVCVLVGSALQPLPLGDLTQLHQLSEVFPEATLRGVFTRVDELPAGELPAMQERARKLLAEALPGRTLGVSWVSGKTGEGVPDLRREVLAALFRVQRERLTAELGVWGSAVSDLRALLEMRALAAVKPETLDRVQTRLDDLLVEEGIRMRGQLPGLAEQYAREVEPTLPRPQRHMTEAFREKLVTKLGAELGSVYQRLNQELADALKGDVDTATTLALADRFKGVLEAGPRFFDWQSAKAAGALGAAGAALVAGAMGKPSGWAVAGAVLLGGLLGGLMGRASTVDTPEELRQRVTEPLTRDAEKRLFEATRASREDLKRLCELLRKVVQVFSGPKAGAYDLAALQRVVSMAEVSHKQLADEVRAFHQKLDAEELLGKLKIQRSAEAPPAEAAGPATEALPATTREDPPA